MTVAPAFCRAGRLLSRCGTLQARHSDGGKPVPRRKARQLNTDCLAYPGNTAVRMASAAVEAPNFLLVPELTGKAPRATFVAGVADLRHRDFQLNTHTGILFVVTSIPRVEPKGAEANVTWATPVNGLGLNGAVTYARPDGPGCASREPLHWAG